MAETEDLTIDAIATEGNVTVTSLENDATYPFVVDGDSIINTNGMVSYNTAQFTVTFTSEEPMILTFDWFNGASAYDYLRVFYGSNTSSSFENYGSTGSYRTGSYVWYFEPGTHTLRFAAYHYSNNSSAGYHGINDVMSYKNIKIVTPESQYQTINLSTPGTLGLEALNITDALPNLKYLRLTGSINSADWADIRKMTGLRALDMSGVTVTDIPENAFTNNSFRFFKFPTTCKTIGRRAFYNRPIFGSLELPEGLESIGEEAFYATSITEVILPATVTSVGNYAFRDNASLRTFTFGGGFTTIPQGFLYYCRALKNVYGCEGIKVVGTEAFSQDYAIETIEGLQPTTVQNSAFYECRALHNFDFSEITYIGSYAFRNCDGLTSAILPKLQSFNSDGYCFYNCDGIRDVVIPDAVTYIPSSCFGDSNGLKNITLGSGITSIGSYAFNSSGCNIEKVYVNSPTPPSVSSSPFYTRSGITLYVPNYAMKSYKLDSYWSQFSTVEENPNPVGDLVIAGNLLLSSGDRIPDTPNVTMYRGGSFEILGTQAQPLGKFTAMFGDTSNSVMINRNADMTSTASEIQYYMNTGYWYFVCMPFDVNVADVYSTVGAQIAIRYYDGESRANNGVGSSWKDVPADGILEAGKGYIFRVSVTGGNVCMPATTLSHNNIFASAAIVTPLADHATEVSSDKNWNLVGNPYAAFYDIYRMDYTAPITVWNVANSTYTAYSVADDEFALMPLQAFFVQKPDLIPSITFQPDGRQKTNVIEHTASAKANMPSSRKVVNITLSNGETTDMTRVVVNPQAADEFDAATDATKMMEFGGTAQIYSMVGDEMFSINEGKQANGLVNLGMWFATDGEYTIDITRADTDVELLDNGTIVAMPYTFRANSDYCEGRFALRIGGIVNSIETINAQKTDNSIYNVAGQKVQNLQKGIYIVNGKKVLK